MIINVTFPGGKRVDAPFDGCVLHTDQSPEHGGQGAAPEPYDLFLASLATCAGAYGLGLCQARGLSTALMTLASPPSISVTARTHAALSVAPGN